MTRPSMLPSGMHTPWAESDRYKDFGAQYHSQPDGHARSVHPRVLSVYASTQDFGGAPFATHLSALIPTLQHSILGVWLTLTQAGYPPACQQTISSPHVHRFVLASARVTTRPSGVSPENSVSDHRPISKFSRTTNNTNRTNDAKTSS